MNSETKALHNIRQAIPFFRIFDMKASLRFYVDGMGFSITNSWSPHDRIEWCAVQRDEVVIMLQEFRNDNKDYEALKGQLGKGVSISFICEDALLLYHEFIGKGLVVSEPFVGNGMWVVMLDDPDGYRLEFESLTDVKEETRYGDL